MKTLLIPDVHNKVDKAQKIIDENPANLYVFLGDIYDDFGDTLTDIRKAAQWHKEKINSRNHIVLLGNHDMPYTYMGNRHLQCTGYTEEKSYVINEIISPEDWDKCKLFCRVHDWLITHAGLHPSLSNGTDMDLIPKCHEARRQATLFRSHPLTSAGRSRRGPAPVGGITWLDWNEFEPIPGIKQICGHTPGAQPRNKGENCCIDTHLNHAAMLMDSTLSTFATVGVELVKA